MRRQRYGPRKNGGSGGLFLIGILILAIAVGYIGTKYVVVPYIFEGKLWTLQEEETKGNRNHFTSESGIISGEQDVKDVKDDETTVTNTGITATDAAVITSSSATNLQDTALSTATQAPSTGTGGLYAVQFGSFSTKQGAETMVSDLKTKAVSAYVMEKDGAYKVLGISFETKEKAKAEAERLRSTIADVYVISM